MSDPMMDTPVLERTTATVLERNVAARPDHLALIDADGATLTYAEVQRRAYAIATSLTALGVERQGQVLIMLDNHADNALTCLGSTVGAMVAVPINTAYKGEFLSYLCALSGASVLVIEGGWCDRLDVLVQGAPQLTTVVVRNGDAAHVPERFIRVPFEALLEGPTTRPDPPAVWDVNAVIFTSGTTGRSKGVLCPHGHAFSMASYPAYQPGEVVLVTLPLFHAAGLWSGVLNAWRAGGTAVLVGTFSASRFWNQVREFNCTSTVLMGAQADFVWRLDPSPDDRTHPLRNVGLIPCPSFVGQFEERFGVRATTAYGLSESGTIVVTQPGEARPPRCGIPRSFVDVRLVDENDIEVPDGDVGEITVRSSQPWSLMRGYFRMPDETADAWRNLWLHSGDAAYRDADGQLVFVDRKKDALRRRGENVSSFEVERHVLACEGVAAAAVVAVPSEFSEDELKAVVVLAPGAEFDPIAMTRRLYEQMPYFMVPRYLEVVDEMPMTPTMKVKKADLRAAGITPATWDCEAAGLKITRSGLLDARPTGTSAVAPVDSVPPMH